MRLRPLLLPAILGIFCLASAGCSGNSGLSPTLLENIPAAVTPKPCRLGDSGKPPKLVIVLTSLEELKCRRGKDKSEDWQATGGGKVQSYCAR
jgi:hypothetical protein